MVLIDYFQRRNIGGLQVLTGDVGGEVSVASLGSIQEIVF